VLVEHPADELRPWRFVVTDARRVDPISRRRALGLGGGVAAGVLAAGSTLGVGISPVAAAGSSTTPGADEHHLPAEEMQEILQAEGSVSNGVLSVGIDRTDFGPVHLRGVRIEPSFELSGDLTFQPLSHSAAFFNGDLPLKENEVDPVIDAILANGLVFQAEHQHFYDFHPQVWFIHFRGQGHPLALARSVHSVLKATATPLPQKPPAHPTTPLDADRLQSILNGYDAEVSDNGVVTVFVSRKDAIHIDGVLVRPETNIATNISFQPLNADGTKVAAAPDFAMEANEINPLMRVMRRHGWDIGCLYNQETDEHPQLFFSHQFKTGNPYTLAHEIRSGLNQTNSH
jgi:hypothetical protein